MSSKSANTTIDRRSHTRTVPMRVLVLGLPRTGTSSIRQALLDLGYRDCYHMASIVNDNPRDADLWVEAYESKFERKGKPWERPEWDALLGHCMAVSDAPAVDFAEELVNCYPEAKVVLSVRDDVEVWYRSVMETLISRIRRQQCGGRVWQFVMRVFGPRRWPSVAEMGRKMVANSGFHDFEDCGREWYEQHNVMVRRIVSEEGGRLLEFNAKEGWGPLCEFLGEEVPKGNRFPRVNTKDEFRNLWMGRDGYARRIAVRNMTMAVGGMGLVVLGLFMVGRRRQ